MKWVKSKTGLRKIAALLLLFSLASGPLYSEYVLSDADYAELMTLVSESRQDLANSTQESENLRIELTNSQNLIYQLRGLNIEQENQTDQLRENLTEQKKYYEAQSMNSFWRGVAVGAGVTVIGIGIYAIITN